MSDNPNVLDRNETRIFKALYEREVLEEKIETNDMEVKRLSSFSASLIRQVSSGITKDAEDESSISRAADSSQLAVGESRRAAERPIATVHPFPRTGESRVVEDEWLAEWREELEGPTPPVVGNDEDNVSTVATVAVPITRGRGRLFQRALLLRRERREQKSKIEF